VISIVDEIGPGFKVFDDKNPTRFNITFDELGSSVESSRDDFSKLYSISSGSKALLRIKNSNTKGCGECRRL